MTRLTYVGHAVIEIPRERPVAWYINTDVRWLENWSTPVQVLISATSPIRPDEAITDAAALASWMQEAGLSIVQDTHRPNHRMDRHTLILARKGS